ncbi:gliding motility lipoprotein GldH [Pararhodonellum marinum]|uniref:gliding motility lipoprotein GldH n=1 Tax=Pararhodonellum marinum TaxID=2755358 RepID=UPI0018902C33|nr:gliding motility lipoprotein GldH [Pararhodonellum marinum]
MKSKIKQVSLILSALFLGLSACDDSRVYESYQSLPGMNWHESDTVSFALSTLPDQTLSGTIGIKYNGDYEFHNLYVKYLLTDSLGNLLQNELINVGLFDSKSGKPLGKGFGNTYTQFDSIPFLANGTGGLEVHFIQYMRVNQLKGIESVGIKINK